MKMLWKGHESLPWNTYRKVTWLHHSMWTVNTAENSYCVSSWNQADFFSAQLELWFPELVYHFFAQSRHAQSIKALLSWKSSKSEREVSMLLIRLWNVLTAPDHWPYGFMVFWTFSCTFHVHEFEFEISMKYGEIFIINRAIFTDLHVLCWVWD